MKRIISIPFLLFSVLFFSCGEKTGDETITEDQLAELREISGEFTKHLKSLLVERMQTGGVMSAVTVCADTAQLLTKNFATDKNVYIKRVSFKNRNPKNYPDDFESAALEFFEEMHAAGKLQQMSEYAEVTRFEDGTYIRYMTPIFIQAPCLNCHGEKSAMSDQVVSFLSEKYPEDKATGYELDELRGAVSIMKKIN